MAIKKVESLIIDLLVETKNAELKKENKFVFMFIKRIEWST